MAESFPWAVHFTFSNQKKSFFKNFRKLFPEHLPAYRKYKVLNSIFRPHFILRNPGGDHGKDNRFVNKDRAFIKVEDFEKDNYSTLYCFVDIYRNKDDLWVLNGFFFVSTSILKSFINKECDIEGGNISYLERILKF